MHISHANEKWLDVVGYEGIYQVSNFGRVRSLDRMIYKKDGTKEYKKGRILKQRITRRNEMIVELYKNKKKKTCLVHRLVAEAFIPNPENKPQINHMDGNRSNNVVNNLEWVTQSENMEHALKMGLRKSGEKVQLSKLTQKQYEEIKNRLQTGNETLKDIAKDYGVTFQRISQIKHGIGVFGFEQKHKRNVV